MKTFDRILLESDTVKEAVIKWLKQKHFESDLEYSKTPTLKIKWENALLQKLLEELKNEN